MVMLFIAFPLLNHKGLQDLLIQPIFVLNFKSGAFLCSMVTSIVSLLGEKVRGEIFWQKLHEIERINT